MKSLIKQFWIGIYIVNVLLLITGCSAHTKFDNKENVNELERYITFNGVKLKGMFNGKEQKGIITLQSNKEGIVNIEGEFTDEGPKGSIQVTYEDGTMASGAVKEGCYNGIVKFTSLDGGYRTINYDKGIKTGRTVLYDKNSKPVSQDWYYKGELLTKLIDRATEHDVQDYYNDPFLYYGEIVKFQGNVQGVYQTSNKCIVKLRDDQGNELNAVYNNGAYDKKRPTIVPTMEEEDRVTVYGEFNGVLKNMNIYDEIGYGYSLPEISILFAEIEGSGLDPFDFPEQPYLYSDIVANPYAFAKKNMELVGIVDAVVINYEEGLVYCKVDVGNQEIFYLQISIDKLEDKDVPMSGDELKIEGTLMGNYIEERSVQALEAYKAYPLLTVLNVLGN